MKKYFTKPVIITIIAIIIFVAITLFVSKKANATLCDETDLGSHGVSSSSKYQYQYSNGGKKYKMTSACVKKLQERILKVYSTYHGNSSYPKLYDTACAMRDAGGADGVLGSKTKAAFDACNFPTLLVNAGAKLDSDYIVE